MLARILTFSPDQDESFFQELPTAAAVFLVRGDGEPYVSKTANLRRRLQRLLGTPAEHSKRLNLRDRVRELEFTATGSDFESQVLLYRLLRETFPKTYSARLRLRPAPLVKLHLENEYPRASVTTRLGKLPHLWGQPPSAVRSSEARQPAELGNGSGLRPEDSRGRLSPHNMDSGATGVSLVKLNGSTGEGAHTSKHNVYYGPFPSRAAAEKFASDALDFFKMRRCVDDLHPDPAFPGCVYSEMKMCLAPCFKGCTDSEYHAEVARVQTFLDTSGNSLARELAEQRERASADLAFEEAAAIHAKIEKLKPVLAQLPEIVRRIDQLAAILVQPSADPGSVSLFRFFNGGLSGPVQFCVEHTPDIATAALPENRVSGRVSQPRSLESRVEGTIQSFPAPEAKSSGERMEQLSMLKRWYYRSSRTGEIFFADEKGAWPLRQIVRGIGRVYRGEKTQEKIADVTPGQAL